MTDSNILYENKLLVQRNNLLQLQNERLLDELETLKLQSMSKSLQKPMIDHQTLPTLRYYSTTQDKTTYSLVEIQRQQLNQLIEQKIQIIQKKMIRLKESNIKDQLKMLVKMNTQSLFTGFFRVLFEITQEYLDIQIKKQQNSHRTKTRMYQNINTQRQTILFVKDPNYISQQLKWVSKFSDEFQIVKCFYQKLVKTIVQRYSITKTTQINLLLHKFSELQVSKLQLYKLAVKAQNQQRQYQVKMKCGKPIQILQIQISNTLQKINFQQNCLKEYKLAITKYLKRI